MNEDCRARALGPGLIQCKWGINVSSLTVDTLGLRSLHYNGYARDVFNALEGRQLEHGL